MVAHADHPNTWSIETGKSWVLGSLHCLACQPWVLKNLYQKPLTMFPHKWQNPDSKQTWLFPKPSVQCHSSSFRNLISYLAQFCFMLTLLGSGIAGSWVLHIHNPKPLTITRDHIFSIASTHTQAHNIQYMETECPCWISSCVASPPYPLWHTDGETEAQLQSNISRSSQTQDPDESTLHAASPPGITRSFIATNDFLIRSSIF